MSACGRLHREARAREGATREAKARLEEVRAAAAGEVPVAAAVIDASGQIIVVAENRMKRDAKSTSHAELLALEAAMSITGNGRLDGCDLWVSLEPCAMCAGAIAHARIRRLYFRLFSFPLSVLLVFELFSFPFSAFLGVLVFLSLIHI